MTSAPETDTDMIAVWADVSDRLRRAREASDVSLRTLAGRIGVSASLISQIETGKVRPSVNTLYALAVELGASVDEILFGSQVADGAGTPVTAWVQRAGNHASVQLAPGVTWQRLTGMSEAGVDFLHLTYAPGSASVPAGTQHRHKGREWGYVVSGALRVEVAGEVHDLRVGDSISFPSTAVHRLSNVGRADTRAVWFILGRSTSDSPAR